MMSDSIRLLLKEEGARCKAYLEGFTENLVASLDLSSIHAEKLRHYDRSREEGNVYLHFPFCFLEAFSEVALEDVRTIALSAVFWMSYMRAQDDALDKKVAADPILLFLRDIYARQSLGFLYTVFPHDSAFWALYASYSHEYVRAVLFENTHHASLNLPYDHTEFWTIAKGKAAMAKYPVAALSMLSGHGEKRDLLTESLDWYHVGYQYWDDIVDWKEDLRASNYSLLLTLAMERLSPEDREGSFDKVRSKIVRVLYFSGLAEDHLSRARLCLERAHELSLAAGCTVWADYVHQQQMQTATLTKDLKSIMAKWQKCGATLHSEPPTSG